jgi:hypothetical protein
MAATLAASSIVSVRHRRHFVKVTVQVPEYPDSTLAIFHGPRRLAGYHPDGTLIEEDATTRSAA